MNFLFSNPVTFINSVQPPLSSIIIFCATTLGTITIVCALLYLFLDSLNNDGAFSKVKNMLGHIHDFMVVAISSVGAYIMAALIKNILEIPRPFVSNLNLHALIAQDGYGFPSEHAATFMALAVAMFFLNRRAGIFFFVLALLIGAGRVLVGVHTPLDVLGGYILGILFSYIVAYFDRKVNMASLN